MGRYRKPQPPSSPYITQAGAKKLRRELKHLWSVVRPEVTAALSAAAAEGDRSENAEYIYRKKQLGEIDRRIRYLGKRLDQIKVVDRVPGNQSKVYFGALVSLKTTDGGSRKYRIVGSDETDAKTGWISIDSPMARSLLGKSVNDSVVVSTPAGSIEYEITDIDYRNN